MLKLCNYATLRGIRSSNFFFKDHFKDTPINIAEVGVFKGENALQMLNMLNISKMWLIDPYLSYTGYCNKDGGNNSHQNELDDAREDAIIRLKNFKDKIQWVYDFSDKAVVTLPKLQLVYIDGNHSKEYVKKDIVQYWDVVEDGGILAGNDYDRQGDSPYMEVFGVINEIVAKTGLEVSITNDSRLADWWIIKPPNMPSLDIWI